MKSIAKTTKRFPLHLIFVIDCSKSMGVDGKIQALNNSIREFIPHILETASKNLKTNVLVRAIKFSDKSKWHIHLPISIHNIKWKDVKTEGNDKAL